jgi:hypothetical protein
MEYMRVVACLEAEIMRNLMTFFDFGKNKFNFNVRAEC